MPLVKGPRPPLPAAGTEAEPARLDAADPAERRRAAHALGGDPAGAARLAARLDLEEDPTVREALLTALVRGAAPAAVDGMLPLLASEDAALRNGVIESLRQMPAELVAPRLEPLLRHENSDLRIFAVQLLSGLRHPQRLAWLAEVAGRDPHVNVCLAAAEGLAELGDPDALPALERLAARFPDEPMVTFAADEARRRFRGA